MHDGSFEIKSLFDFFKKVLKVDDLGKSAKGPKYEDS